MAEPQALGAGGLGSNPTSATPWLWDTRQELPPLCLGFPTYEIQMIR